MDKNRTMPAALLTASAIALSFFASGALAAQAAGPSGYVQLGTGGTLRATTAAVCVRTGYWAPSMATSECDPDLVPKPPAPPVPRVAPPPPAKPAPKPAPKPAAPAPKPKPRAAVTPVIEKVTLQSDALFDFDRAVIRKDAQSKLDDLTSKMKGVNLEVVIAVGHTDRIGSDAYNMKLSLRRADAVKGYLVSKGIPANRIYTEGKGERQPATKAGACKGLRDKKLIACLQPDRRVVVEIVGTRSR